MAIFAKISSSFFRTLQVLGTLYMAGIMVYFTIKLSNGSRSPDGKALALMIMSGAAFVYAVFVFLLQICLLQKTFFRVFVILGDFLFCGAFVAIAVLLRSNAGQKCSKLGNNIASPSWLGNISGVRPKHVCDLITGLFATACALAGLFAITLIIAVLTKSKKKETYVDNRNSRGSFMPFGKRKSGVDDRRSMDTGVTGDLEKASEIDGAGYRGTAPAAQPTIPVVAAPIAANATRSPGRTPVTSPPLTNQNSYAGNTHAPMNNQNSYVGGGGGLAPPNAGMNRAVSPGSYRSDAGYENSATQPPELEHMRTPDYPQTNAGYNAYNPERGSSYVVDDGPQYNNNVQRTATTVEEGHVDPNVGGVTGNIFRTHIEERRA